MNQNECTVRSGLLRMRMEKEIPDLAELYGDFVNAAGDVAAAEGLAVLIDQYVEPLVKDIVRGKFKVSLQDSDDRELNQSALDLVSEVKTLIVAKLSKQRNGKGFAPIDNLEAYVKAVTKNAANQYIRRRNPNRLRLKNQLRYLLSHDRRFSLWKSDDGRWFCAKRDLRANGSVLRRPLSDELRAELEAAKIFPERADLVDVVAGVFDRREGIFSFNDLIGLIFELRKLTEPIEIDDELLSESRSTRPENDVHGRMEQTAYLGALWREVGKLPLRHRAALLLNLRDQNGDAMIIMFPLTRVATISQIADILEFSADEFARIWSELPWDDLTIAEYLGLTRQQVINLRQSARMTLRRKLERF